MTVAFRAKRSAGRVVIWDKPVSGDPMAPFNDPVGNFESIKFCSDFQYLAVHQEADVTINHTSLAGADGTGYTVGNGSQSTGSSAPIADGQIRTTSIELLTHGLGYAPLVFVLLDGRLVSPGLMVQTENDNARVRMVSVYVTTTKVYLKEIAISDADDLSATSLDYHVLVFKDPTADAARPFLRIKPDEEMVLAWGKVSDSDLPIRRAGVGDATFYVPVGRTTDIRNGAIRNISPISGVLDWGFYVGGFVEAEAIQVTY